MVMVQAVIRHHRRVHLARPLTIPCAGRTGVWSLEYFPAKEYHVSAFVISTGIVALAEIGDKTQLLAFILAAKFKKPIPIIFGILIATLVNHGLAGAIGEWLTSLATPQTMGLILGVSFIAMALWTLIPDKFDEADAKLAHFGIFGTTLVAFFLAEMGDKTQVATVALAAKYQTLLPVVAGTTLGMMIANVPAVFVGKQIAQKMPVKLVHSIAAAIFAVLGMVTLVGTLKPELFDFLAFN